MANLTQAGVTFGNGETLQRDPIRLMYTFLGLANKSLPNSMSYSTWNNGLGGRNGRGTYYNDYHSVDEYGTFTYRGQSKVDVTNYGSNTLRVNVVGGIFDGTDDVWRYYVVRDGAAVSASQHSGGTTIIDSGNQAPGGTGPFTTTVQQDIAAGATATFWLYASVLNGSNPDYLSPYLATSFNAWV